MCLGLYYYYVESFVDDKCYAAKTEFIPIYGKLLHDAGDGSDYFHWEIDGITIIDTRKYPEAT